MKDLYKRIGVAEQATQQAVQEALSQHGAALDTDTADAARYVLLDTRRRAVYDRNRVVLATIGHLRSHLGMNLRPFWARADTKDFTYISAPRRRDQPTDPVAVIRAASRGRRKRTRRRWTKRLIVLAVILVIIAVLSRRWWLFA